MFKYIAIDYYDVDRAIIAKSNQLDFILSKCSEFCLNCDNERMLTVYIWKVDKYVPILRNNNYQSFDHWYNLVRTINKYNGGSILWKQK